ncbi:O-methyltransferase [Devosia rhodophyticola]|uniref:O-methyltransferase n=1 Tax=Devosia rhodophyticola TaxID=3026423 RepID=A0ABY7YX67_9HYPH|nr:O-methyltransferase [Devosia rhodophyticola]WDR05978.1 O-methyltransferase [Devosia rhodophyticola]
MSAKLWADVDRYIAEKLIPANAALDATLASNHAEGLPAIDVSAAQGKLLHLLVRMCRARRVLEIGTLGGYSTIWMARALPSDGKVTTLEFEPHHVAVAKTNIERAGLSSMVDIRVGNAVDTLPLLASEVAEPFDFIFIDADKPSNPDYLDWAMKLSRRGTVIVCDNVIRGGGVIDPESTDANINGARAAFDTLSRQNRIESTALQTVGAKGYDGFAIGIVR